MKVIKIKNNKQIRDGKYRVKEGGGAGVEIQFQDAEYTQSGEKRGMIEFEITGDIMLESYEDVKITSDSSRESDVKGYIHIEKKTIISELRKEGIANIGLKNVDFDMTEVQNIMYGAGYVRPNLVPNELYHIQKKSGVLMDLIIYRGNDKEYADIYVDDFYISFTEPTVFAYNRLDEFEDDEY